MKKIIFLLLIIYLTGCSTLKQEEKDNISENEDVIQKKEITIEDYKSNNVNELGKVPIMMYHGIYNKKNSETEYTGGNIDKDGYQRTSESFKNDLEFYYNSGYRMIRLTDYIDGNIDVELGKSPIILTFDDGLENNIKVTGLNNNGEIIIDPNSAIGILESFKEQYPDFNVTATFFVNGTLFGQEEYNEKILKWLVKHGYDVGNHTYNHVNFSDIDEQKTKVEVGSIYEILDTIIPNKYVNIVALPFGSPYSLEHSNMDYIFNTSYNNKNYITKSALRVGWEAESSPFSNEFNPKFLKRIRAYDNDGKDFDIKMNFNLLENNKYISDGNKDVIVIPNSEQNLLYNKYNKKVITY